ncbi:hypothetical protein AO391_24390 [Pseudomonas marginalis ICMP 9505]|nr:hypothetical protein AO391_24390 [Pseudomonas marginalis ICMP 9505]
MQMANKKPYQMRGVFLALMYASCDPANAMSRFCQGKARGHRRLLIGCAHHVLASAQILDNWMPRFRHFGSPIL